MGVINTKPPFLGVLSGRYRTRTYDFLCVREYHGVPTVSICYIWWSVVHTVLPVGGVHVHYVHYIHVVLWYLHPNCTDMMEDERFVVIPQFTYGFFKA